MNKIEDKESNCSGCGHFIGHHIQSVDGNVYCWNVETRISTGVVMKYNIRCDCTNYISERTEAENKKKQEEKLEGERHFQELLKAMQDKKGVIYYE